MANSHGWTLTDAGNPLKPIFPDLDAVFALQGEQITQDSLSDLIKLKYADAYYYVKRYTSAGKALKQFLGKSRIQGEWENLQLFAEWGIQTATLIGYGLEKKRGLFYRGAIITQEIPNAQDLSQLASDKTVFNQKAIAAIIEPLANFTRIMHQHGFVHNDLKWRNILVDDKLAVYLIDCPVGDFWRGKLLSYRIIKDLKTLDNHAKKHLSNTNRLRFFLQYKQSKKLNNEDKQVLNRLLQRHSRRHDQKSNLGLVFKNLG